MNKSCLIKVHHAGLFSQVNKVITCLERYQQIQVDWRNNLYGTDDLWTYLFEPLPSVSEPFDVVERYPHMRYTGMHAGWLYLCGEPWRERLHKQWLKLKVREDILVEVDSFSKLFDAKTISLQKRFTGHSCEQLRKCYPTNDQFMWALEKASNDSGNVFLMDDTEESLEWFRQRLGNRALVFPSKRQRKDADKELHSQGLQTYTDARNTLIEALLISRTKHLVHAVSNIATAVLYINPKLDNTFLQ